MKKKLIRKLNPLLKEAWEEQQAGRLKKAQQLYGQALQKDPLDALAWCYLGWLYYDKQAFLEAEAAYRIGLQLQPDFSPAWNNLGSILLKLKRPEEARKCYQNARSSSAKDKSYNISSSYLSEAEASLFKGHISEAEGLFKKALAIAPHNIDCHTLLSVVQLVQGKFLEGWPDYRYYWEEKKGLFPPMTCPFWDGSSLKGKRLLILSDQGIGDILLLVRYCKQLKAQGAHVIFACDRLLFPLLNCSPSLDIDEFSSGEGGLPQADFFVPLGQIPGILKTTVETIPSPSSYLSADSSLIQQWKKTLSAYQGFRIGIAWRGNPQFTDDSKRSIPLTAFTPLARIPGVQLISLKKGVSAEEVGDFPLIQFPVDEGDAGAFMDTAALMHSLDLVISSDTSIVHLAAAQGIPTWLALSSMPHWIWLLDRKDSPWYPNLTLFRQQTLGDWSWVFDCMAEKLKKILEDTRIHIDLSPQEFAEELHRLEHLSAQAQDPEQQAATQDSLSRLKTLEHFQLAPSQEWDRLKSVL